MPTDRHLVGLAVYLVLERNARVALLRRAGTGWEDGRYSLVAGHVDAGEPAVGAAIREAREEAGVEIAATDLTLVHTMHRSGEMTYLDLFFSASRWEGEPHVTEPQKADDLAWFRLDSLPSNIVPSVRTALHMIAEGKTYSDLGW